MALKLTKAEKKITFQLPIEQAVLVPSTISGNKPISLFQRKRRVNEVKKYLSNRFGGYTSVNGNGGYYSDKKKKLIQEPVAIVTSFSTKQSFHQGEKNLKKQLRFWAKRWGQESMGYIYEGDLFYFSPKKKRR